MGSRRNKDDPAGARLKVRFPDFRGNLPQLVAHARAKCKAHVGRIIQERAPPLYNASPGRRVRVTYKSDRFARSWATIGAGSIWIAAAARFPANESLVYKVNHEAARILREPIVKVVPSKKVTARAYERLIPDARYARKCTLIAYTRGIREGLPTQTLPQESKIFNASVIFFPPARHCSQVDVVIIRANRL